jgi:alanyl-tRNA synthetase
MPKYYEDPYLKELEVRVVSRRGDYLKFDDTIFYPGGGGQPHDTGYFKGENFLAEIIDVKKDEDGIWHRIRKLNGEPEDKGKIYIDWERRYYLMKSHTGEHILYRSLEKLYPVRFVKVEFNVPESVIFIDGRLSIDDIEKAEEMANSIVSSNIPVTVEVKALEDSGDIRIRRDRIREGEIRVVRIGDFDSSACAGVHVKNTGEIGRIHVKKIKYSRENEIFFVVGDEALKEIEISKNAYRRISHLLNDFSNVYEKIVKMKTELDKLRDDYYKITEGMFRFENYTVNGINVYFTKEEIGDIRGIEKRAYSISEREKCVIIIARRSLKRIEIINSTDIDLRLNEFINEMGLKGGGKKNFLINVQEDIFDSVYAELISRIEKILRESPR